MAQTSTAAVQKLLLLVFKFIIRAIIPIRQSRQSSPFGYPTRAAHHMSASNIFGLITIIVLISNILAYRHEMFISFFGILLSLFQRLDVGFILILCKPALTWQLAFGIRLGYSRCLSGIFRLGRLASSFTSLVGSVGINFARPPAGSIFEKTMQSYEI